MKGNEKVIEKLNDLLSDELTAINQYMVHSEMCDNWGYERLHKLIEKRAIDEMKHAEKLIARILFLEGRPIVSHLKKISIGAEVPAQHQNDWDAEDGAIKSYNDGIRLALELGDNGSRELMDSISEGRGRPYRLDRSSTRRDQADGRRELPGGADRLGRWDRQPEPASDPGSSPGQALIQGIRSGDLDSPSAHPRGGRLDTRFRCPAGIPIRKCLRKREQAPAPAVAGASDQRPKQAGRR